MLDETANRRLLVLVRHGEAEHSWRSDFDRPLTARGAAQARERGSDLAQRPFAADAIVSSPARRAWSTAELLATELGIAADAIRSAAEVYEAGVRDLLDVVGAFDPAWRGVILVGHNPGLSHLAASLTRNHVALDVGAGFEIEFQARFWREIELGGVVRSRPLD